MRTLLRVAAVAALLTGGNVVTVEAANSTLGVPTAYTQMNSPGDGISSGAARTGNGRRRVRHYRHRHHHWHHRRGHRR